MATKIQSWRLFWLLVALISAAVGLGLPGVDFHSDRAVEGLILRTILVALPCLLAAFTASSLVKLWPGRRTRWLLANRRYIGLAFAAGMIWHFALHTTGIYTLWFLPTFFFLEDVLQRRDIFDGAAVGVLLAVLMLRLAGRGWVKKPVSLAQAG